MTINNFLIKTIFGQLKQDLLGNDACRGVTLSYTWLANQFGYFAMALPNLLYSACTNCSTCTINCTKS